MSQPELLGLTRAYEPPARSLVAVVERMVNGSIPARVKALRGRVRKQLTDPEADFFREQERSLYDDLDTLFVVVQLYSYPVVCQYSIQRLCRFSIGMAEDSAESFASRDRCASRKLDPRDLSHFRGHSTRILFTR